MACKSRHLIVHCAAPSSVLGDVVPVNSHEHKHAFTNLADDLLVDGDARALDALQHEAHGGCVCCEEQQESGARQRRVMGRLDSVKRSRAWCESSQPSECTASTATELPG